MIGVAVVAAFAIAIPALLNTRGAATMEGEDPAERFSITMQIVRRDVMDFIADSDAAEVSTPLTRKAELTELRLLSKEAAVRRARIALALLVLTVVTGLLTMLRITPLWSFAVPGLLLIGFLGASPVLVKMMHRRFDERRRRAVEGFQEGEDTTVLGSDERDEDDDLEDDEDSAGFADSQQGNLWDPIPVTTPTYVSQPLAPRTVRTIDLAAPVTPPPVVPTADHPDENLVADAPSEEIDTEPGPGGLRAV